MVCAMRCAEGGSGSGEDPAGPQLLPPARRGDRGLRGRAPHAPRRGPQRDLLHPRQQGNRGLRALETRRPHADRNLGSGQPSENWRTDCERGTGCRALHQYLPVDFTFRLTTRAGALAFPSYNPSTTTGWSARLQHYGGTDRSARNASTIRCCEASNTPVTKSRDPPVRCSRRRSPSTADAEAMPTS